MVSRCCCTKPFAGVNGSSKHVNWSLATDGAQPAGTRPHTGENLQFSTFWRRPQGIHRHGDLMRATSLSRAIIAWGPMKPPAIMSVFLGQQVIRVLDALEAGEDIVSRGKESLGIANFMTIEKDATDRNRTSPFAFTGNKFEFRAVGSSQAIAMPLTVINAVVAEALNELNAELEKKLRSGKDLKAAVQAVVRDAVVETKAIRFEGNGYSKNGSESASARIAPRRGHRGSPSGLGTRKTQAVFTKSGI